MAGQQARWPAGSLGGKVDEIGGQACASVDQRRTEDASWTRGSVFHRTKEADRLEKNATDRVCEYIVCTLEI